MPDRPPLVLKINDKLSLKCIWVPPGKFLMGEPYYQCPHWQEAPPHMVTLTKGFYMAEHPVTQEMFEAVMGNNPSTEKAAKAPVNVSCAGMYEFCRVLSQKSGRKVRVPTAAEWEYAARVGTSNPAFREKYTGPGQQRRATHGGQVQAAQCLGLLRHGQQRVGAGERRFRTSSTARTRSIRSTFRPKTEARPTRTASTGTSAKATRATRSVKSNTSRATLAPNRPIRASSGFESWSMRRQPRSAKGID